MKVLGGRETFDVKLTNDSMFDLALTKSKDTNKVDISLHLYDQHSPLVLETTRSTLSFLLYAPITTRAREIQSPIGAHRRLSIDIDP